uniref:(northern house mosquito) hypothetical protein n=1 Tax=Culex pipiens TaxID=7175 RepID=A0A8D8GD17_CULPI
MRKPIHTNRSLLLEHGLQAIAHVTRFIHSDRVAFDLLVPVARLYTLLSFIRNLNDHRWIRRLFLLISQGHNRPPRSSRTIVPTTRPARAEIRRPANSTVRRRVHLGHEPSRLVHPLKPVRLPPRVPIIRIAISRPLPVRLQTVTLVRIRTTARLQLTHPRLHLRNRHRSILIARTHIVPVQRLIAQPPQLSPDLLQRFGRQKARSGRGLPRRVCGRRS